jgi:hypothetical protein
MQGNRTEKPLGGLISDLFHGQIELIRQEIELAKLEMGIKAGRTFKCLLLVAAGGGLLLSVFILLLGGIVVALSVLFSPVLALLAVSLSVGGAGALIMGIGVYMISREDFIAGDSIEAVEQQVELVAEETA